MSDLLRAYNPRGPIALDLGQHTLRSVKRDSNRLSVRSERSIYAVCARNDKHEHTLINNGINYAYCEDGLIVPGDAARPVSLTFHCPIANALENGRVPTDDPVGRQVLSILVQSLLTAPSVPTVCAFSTSSMDARTASFCEGLIRLQGYQPLELDSATAAGYCLLEQGGLTGIAIDAGAAKTRITAILSGQSIASRTIETGGVDLDKSFFLPEEHRITTPDGDVYQDYEASRELREAYSSVSTSEPPRSRLKQYRQFAIETAKTVVELFETACVGHLFARPTTVAVSGGLAQDRFFTQILSATIARLDTAAYFKHPIRIKGDGLSVARGLLMAAEAETNTKSQRVAA